jgi:predicted secreted protein
MKQTAVEWLVEQICGDHTEQWQKEIEQAKEMEKEQIEIAFFKGDLFAEDYFDADNPTKDVSENYYNKTFKQ